MTNLDRVVILNDFSSAQGGAEYLANALASGLAERSIPVTFICADRGRDGWQSGVTPVPLNGAALTQGNKTAQAVRGLYNRRAASEVRKWIGQHDTPRTIYHLHNWSNILSPSVFDALAPVAARCLIHAHDFFLACPNGMFLDFPRAEICRRKPLSRDCLMANCDKRNYPQKLWRFARHRVLARRLRAHLDSSQFVMIHEAMRPWLTQSLQPKNLSVIRNPVTRFGPVVPAPERQRGIAHIGQVQRLKGVYDLAQAGRNLGLVIDFFGAGQDLDDLRRNYPEHTYHGFTSRADIAKHLGRMRAVVVATQSPEPFCLAAFESIATGMPLLASRAILAEPELTHSGAALAFDAGNVASLTAALEQVINDDARTAALARAARARARDPSLTDWIDDHIGLYEARLNTAVTHSSKETSLALP